MPVNSRGWVTNAAAQSRRSCGLFSAKAAEQANANADIARLERRGMPTDWEDDNLPVPFTESSESALDLVFTPSAGGRIGSAIANRAVWLVCAVG